MARSSFAIAFAASALALVAAAPATADALWFRCGDDLCRSRPDGGGKRVAVPAGRLPAAWQYHAVSRTAGGSR